VRAAASLAWVMSINAVRNLDRSGEGLAVEGLANSRAVPKKTVNDTYNVIHISKISTTICSELLASPNRTV